MANQSDDTAILEIHDANYNIQKTQVSVVVNKQTLNVNEPYILQIYLTVGLFVHGTPMNT